MQVLDYSAGYPGAAAIAAAGYGGAVRYLRKEGTSRVRPVTAAERADFDAHGLGLALVYQAISTSRVLEGEAAGAHDARWALDRAAEIGIPRPRALYFAVDHDHPPTAVGGYFAGVHQVLDADRVAVGGYGGYFVVAHLLDRGLITYAWQTTGWSTRRNPNGTKTLLRENRAALFQRVGTAPVGGIACDINDVLAADWGQHNLEDDMQLTDQIRNWGADRKDDKPVGTLDEITYWTWRYANENRALADRQLAELAATRAAIAQIAANPDITPERLNAAVDDAVARHTPTAADVAAEMLPTVEQLADRVAQADNVAQAAEVIRQLGAQLRTAPAAIGGAQS